MLKSSVPSMVYRKLSVIASFIIIFFWSVESGLSCIGTLSVGQWLMFKNLGKCRRVLTYY